MVLSDDIQIEESVDCEENGDYTKENKQPECSEVQNTMRSTQSLNRKVTAMQLQVLEAQLEAANATKVAMVEVKEAATEFRSFLSKLTSKNSESISDEFSFVKFLEES